MGGALCEADGNAFTAWMLAGAVDGTLSAFLVAFGVVVVAEFGDKTQFAVLALAGRHRPLPVLLGAACAFAALTLLAVVAGAALARFVPRDVVATASGLAFAAAGIWMLLRRAQEETGPDTRTGRRPFLQAFLVVAGAEFLDKTELATAGLAAGGHPVATGMGALLGLLVDTAAAVVAGAWLSRKVPPRALRIASGLLFLAVGLALLAEEAWGHLRR